MKTWDGCVRLRTTDEQHLDIHKPTAGAIPGGRNAAFGITGVKREGKWTFWISGDAEHYAGGQPLTLDGLLTIKDMIGKIQKELS